MNNIKKFPKAFDYTNNTDPTGFKRQYERGFGEGSWAELEARVLERHPEFALFNEEPKQLPTKRWWQFWKEKSNVVQFKKEEI